MGSVLRRLAGEWRLHLVVIVLVVASELIYTREIPLGPGAILLLPLLYAFVFGALLNPNVVRRSIGGLIRRREIQAASPFIVIAIMPFIAKFGTLVGPSMQTIIEAGPALILQELGNLGTILIAFPVAVLLLRMGREVIGAAHSIAREPNVAIISDKYGLNTKEGTGVMGVYVTGTLFGTILFTIMASLLGSLQVFHPFALAMACGVGSGSMMAACSGALANIFPDMQDQIVAFAGASNILTYASGLYLSLFVAIPVCEYLYRKLGREDQQPASTEAEGEATS
ncbi:MAG: DUF3100 domain-containing protein [Rubrobacteraceae bacterium]